MGKIKETYEAALNEKYDVSKAVEIAKSKSKEYQKLVYNQIGYTCYVQHRIMVAALFASLKANRSTSCDRRYQRLIEYG